MFNLNQNAAGANEQETDQEEGAAVQSVAPADQAEASTKPEVKIEPAVYEIIDNLEVRVVTETITFKAVKDSDKKEGFDYEAVVDADKKPTGSSRRKAETVRIGYPLLSNFGISSPYDEAKNDYADKQAALLYSLICNAIYNEVRGILNEGKGFTLEEISFNTIANKERSTRGGRQAEVDQVLLEKAVESLEAFLTAEGKKKEVVSHHVQMFKTRLRAAAATREDIVTRMQINMGRWFESLSAEKQEEFGSVFIFWDSKFKAALGTAISDEDY